MRVIYIYIYTSLFRDDDVLYVCIIQILVHKNYVAHDDHEPIAKQVYIQSSI